MNKTSSFVLAAAITAASGTAAAGERVGDFAKGGLDRAFIAGKRGIALVGDAWP